MRREGKKREKSIEIKIKGGEEHILRKDDAHHQGDTKGEMTEKIIIETEEPIIEELAVIAGDLTLHIQALHLHLTHVHLIRHLLQEETVRSQVRHRLYHHEAQSD